MNLQPLKSLFSRSNTKEKKRKTQAVDKWYEYSSMNDLYNPTLNRIKKLKTIKKDPKKKMGSA